MTCADVLAVLGPWLIRPLFEPEAVGRLRSLAQDLPGECQGTLELRLAPGAARADLSLRVLTVSQALDMAARLPPSPARDLLSLWTEPEGPLAPVRSIWLEFDLDRRPREGQVPLPVVCAKLPREVDPRWLVGTLLPALEGSALRSGARDLILACLSSLPASASLLYAFSLRARGSDAVRLEIFGMEPGQILAYLRQMAPGMLPAVAEAVPLFEGAERLHLSFDIAEQLLPRIGLEGSFPRQPSREPRWEGFLTRFVERGLCSPEKREAILAWPGYDTFWTAPERWPVAEAGARGFCIRGLSHLKVVCAPQRGPEAKAYLVFGPWSSGSHPLSAGTLGEGERQSQLARHP